MFMSYFPPKQRLNKFVGNHNVLHENKLSFVYTLKSFSIKSLHFSHMHAYAK